MRKARRKQFLSECVSVIESGSMLPAAPVAPEAETPAPAGLRFGGLRGRNEAAQLRARWEQDAARLARARQR